MNTRLRIAAAAAMVVAGNAAHALTFNFTFLSTSTPQANQAFIDAGARWSALFTDNITLNMTVGTATLGTGILASTGSARSLYTYSDFKTALTADASSSNDATAVANLPAGSSFGMLINRTSDNPNGSGSATTYVDNNASANNTSIRITNANAKALGLTPTAAVVGSCASACDASITFGNSFTWDYNPNDGIAANAYDFVGIATHEIGHALGFISGVDILDINSPGTSGPFPADAFTYVSSLDLFRYSTLSKASNVIDWTADTRAKYFSINGGTTQYSANSTFSTGTTWGDGRQASHWKDSQSPISGILDPTAGLGELLTITTNDTTAFDVIGWNVATSVPEPGTYAMFGLGLAALAARRRFGARRQA